MKIKIKDSTMISPAKCLPNKSLWLSNVDIRWLRYQQSMLYLYKSINGSLSSYEVLKDAMSKVLVPFYPVAGRLGRDENGRLHINCNSKGVLFIEAETDSAIGDQLGDFVFGAHIRQLIPNVDYSKDISSFPLFVVQVTTFKCGGLSLGIRWHHILGDAASTSQFINTWCGLALGVFSNNLSPFIDRTILSSRGSTKPTSQRIEYDHKPPNAYNPTNNAIEILEITPPQLNTLKDQVKAKYSTFRILTAHIWRCTCKARRLSGDQTTKLTTAVNFRSILNPPLQPGYFGNAAFHAIATALCKDLLVEPLKDSVERIDKAIKKMDDKYLRSAIDNLQEQDDDDITTNVRPNLSIINLIRMPFYEADFGMGKPEHFSPMNPLKGTGYILPHPRNDGSLKLTICLETDDHTQSFKKYFYEFTGISRL